MGITFITAPDLADRFSRARQIIASIEEDVPPGMRGRVRIASDLLTSIEDGIADGKRAESGQL